MHIYWKRYKSSLSERWYAYVRDTQRVDGQPRPKMVAYLGGIQSELRNQAADTFWKQVCDRLDELHLPDQERVKLEASIAKRVPNPNIKAVPLEAALPKRKGAIQKAMEAEAKSKLIQHSSKSQEWYTPAEYIELARQVMGGINLDPASNNLAQGWIKATTFYTVDDDGLSKPWHGRLWLNPPYRNAAKWTDKAIASYLSGDVVEAILLVKPAVGASWFQRLSKQFPKCDVGHRIKFIDANGVAQPRPAHGNTFFYLGRDCDHFAEVFRQIGNISIPV